MRRHCVPARRRKRRRAGGGTRRRRVPLKRVRREIRRLQLAANFAAEPLEGEKVLISRFPSLGNNRSGEPVVAASLRPQKSQKGMSSVTARRRREPSSTEKSKKERRHSQPVVAGRSSSPRIAFVVRKVKRECRHLPKPVVAGHNLHATASPARRRLRRRAGRKRPRSSDLTELTELQMTTHRW